MHWEYLTKILKCDKTFMPFIYQNNLQNETDEQLCTNLLNKVLSSSKSRLSGLELLSGIIELFPAQYVLDNAFNWLNICLLAQQDSLKEIKMTVIGKIVEKAYKDQDFTKKILSDHMTKIMDMCLSSQVNQHEIEAGLLVLSICMKRFSSWFGPHKSKIQDFLVKLMFHESKTVVEKAAYGFVQVQQVGGAGVDAVNHRSNFSTAFHKIIVTVQKLFDQQFEGETEIDEYHFLNEEAFPLPDAVYDKTIIAEYIANCLIFIKTMMKCGFPTHKDIKPMEVLNVIKRGTSIHLCLSTSQQKSYEDFQFSISLSSIQINLLELLHVFIICLQRNSLPFSYTISKILIDSLSRSQNCKCFTSYYKETVYKVLQCWLGIARSAFQLNFQVKLLHCILQDITPPKDEIKLIVNESRKHKRSKSVQDSILSKAQKDKKGISSCLEQIDREKNCLAGLNILNYFLSNNWVRINDDKLQGLYTTLVDLLLDVVTSRCVHPYTNPLCQETLLDVLISLYEDDNLSVIPNLSLVLDILNKGRNGRNLRISAVCKRGLSYLERFCQPIFPPLYSTDMFVVRPPNEQLFVDEISEMIAENSDNDDDQPDLVVPGQDVSFDDSAEIGIENGKAESNFTRKKSMHILDVQILKPPRYEDTANDVPNSDVIFSKSEAPLEQTVTCHKTPNEKSSQLTAANNSETAIIIIDDIPDNAHLNIKGTEIEEPPSKIMRFEEPSEISDDDFVDLVKEY